MVEWEKWLLFAFVILAIAGALFVNAENNRQENCYEKCCTEDPIAKSFCATDCQNYIYNCDQNSEGTEWQK